jgi:serine protease Do/serine protease DegQ
MTSAQLRMRALAFSLLLAHGLAFEALAQTAPPVPVPTLAPMVAKVTPGVVGIAVYQQRQQDNPLANDPAYRRFFEERQQRPKGGEKPGAKPGTTPPADEVQGAGSGVVIDAANGLVMTNHHVVQSATRIVVVLKDRRELEARLVGSDPGTDVALLKIAAGNLTAVPLADSDDLAVGDYVVAIGNPFGLGQSVTAGIVSALGRGLSPEGYEDYIQTDAPINPGNSGGALINLRGELVGMPTAILGARGSGGGGGQPGNIGIGFAVPTNMARAVIAQLQRFGEVRRGRIGLQSTDLTPRIASERKLAITEGALIEAVEGDSPAQRAGLRVGDVVVQLNGRPVRNAADLRNKVGLIAVGESARLQWVRGSAAPAEATVAIAPVATPPATTAAAPATPPQGGRPSTPTPPAQAGSGEGLLAGVQLTEGQQGLTIARIDAGSRAYGVGLRTGDVILGVDRQPASTLAALNAALRAPGEHTVSVLRGESKFRLVVRN